MEKKAKLLLGVRKKNGQIGYLSDGITIPEFFNLVRPQANNVSVLIDFYPIIEKLHLLHDRHKEETIRIEFNALYNYWLDARSFSDKQILMSKSEQLSLAANNLLNKLKLKLDDQKNKFITSNNTSSYQRLESVKSILLDSDIYIDSLLCFIHSKASLEICSFKQDIVLMRYAEDLKRIIYDIYLKSIDCNGRSNYESSFLRYITFEKNDKLNVFLDALSNVEKSDSFQLNILRSVSPQGYDADFRGHNRQVTFSYKEYDDYDINVAELLLGTISKISSLIELLKKLKEHDVKWASGDESVEETNALNTLLELPIKQINSADM